MSERVVLVVGASSGIGRATAHALAANGDRLVLSSRGKAALDDTAEECRSLGATEVVVAPLDVVDRESVATVLAGLMDRHGRLDAVVHAAGVVAYGRFEDIPADVFDAVVNTNLHGAANVARATLPIFRRQRSGSLVLVGSVIGEIAAPMMTPYAVSKYAVRSLGRQLSIENRDLPDVHISVVSPGSVDTPIYRQAANFLGRPGRPPAPVGRASTVGRSIVETLDRPRDRVSVGVANPIMRVGFTVLPKAFDALVGPLFAVVASKPQHQEPTTGNVFAADNDREAVDGGEGQGLRDFLGRLRGA